MEESDDHSLYFRHHFFQAAYIFFCVLIFVLIGCCLVQHFLVVIIQNYVIFYTMFNAKLVVSFVAKYSGKVVPFKVIWCGFVQLIL